MFSLARILNSLAALTGAFTLFGGPSETADDDRTPVVDQRPVPTIVIHDTDPRWEDDLHADLARFETAGLGSVVADIHVWGGESNEPCLGHSGVFRPNGGVPRVDICIDFSDSSLGARLRHQLVLHELAHAWIHANTSSAQRDAFAAERGAPSWSDSDTAHSARGTELAANALMGMLHPDAPSNPDRLCGFELLTGRDSVADRLDPCAGI